MATDPAWFDQIVFCGLIGKRATSFEWKGVTKVIVDEVADMPPGKIGAQLRKSDADG